MRAKERRFFETIQMVAAMIQAQQLQWDQEKENQVKKGLKR